MCAGCVPDRPFLRNSVQNRIQNRIRTGSELGRSGDALGMLWGQSGEWILVDSCGFFWILVDSCGFWWVLVDSGEFWWILVDLAVRVLC